MKSNFCYPSHFNLKGKPKTDIGNATLSSFAIIFVLVSTNHHHDVKQVLRPHALVEVRQKRAPQLSVLSGQPLIAVLRVTQVHPMDRVVIRVVILVVDRDEAVAITHINLNISNSQREARMRTMS